MKIIELSSGRSTLVSEKDYEKLAKYNWYFDGNYACRSKWNKETKKESKLYMHREIMKDNLGEKMYVDHINNDTLNNTRENLRVVSVQQNSMNQSTQKRNKLSKYKGVSYDKSRNKWIAYIKFNRKPIHLGRFDSEKEAALAYNNKSKELFGEYTRLNVIED